MIHPHRKSKDRSRTPVPLGPDLEHRLRSYVTSAKALAANWEKAAVAVSALGVVLASTPLEAEVVYTPTNEVLHRDTSGVSVLNINLSSNGVTQISNWISAAPPASYANVGGCGIQSGNASSNHASSATQSGVQRMRAAFLYESPENAGISRFSS